MLHALTSRRLHTSASLLAPAPPSLLALPALVTDAHHLLASSWVGAFAVADIPRDKVTTTFSRSSGPGGQHVNKTNSKATVRVELAGWLPPFVLPPLSKDPHFLAHTPALQIASQETRVASSNAAHALSLAHAAIARAAASVVRGQTSAAQRARVRELVGAEQRRVRESKMKHKSKKASRRGD
ncbi:hypothetical protein Q5752_004723 [Cryptotrichosporon argae]